MTPTQDQGADPVHDSTAEVDAGADAAAARAAREEQVGRAAEGIGRALGRFARKARPEAERLAQRARPEAERLAQNVSEKARQASEQARPEIENLARKARTAAEAALPHVERAGRDAVQFARDHESEIKRAALTSAEFTARRVVPLPLRPIVDAVEADRRRRPPLTDNRAPDETPPRPPST